MTVALCLCLFSILILGFALANPMPENSSAGYTDVSFFHSPNVEPLQHAPIGAKRCMEPLGCFEITTDFYDSVHRPINFLPHDRATINTRFELYTKHNPMEPYFLDSNDPKEIKESHIDPKLKTIFIVHGFFDSALYGKWMERLKTQLLLHGNFNVIIVDWSKGNGAPYTQATANTRVVGAEIAHLIKTLDKVVGISPMDCHVIGHSLGSHIAGYAGERLNKTKLGRITALDPAQPYFQKMPPSVRIDPTDADFVDVIHTDSASATTLLALGMHQAVGHVDFYPNNGRSQPGCRFSSVYSIFFEGLFDSARQFVSCNHQRAVEYFIYSLNYKRVLPVSHQCLSWEDYKDGRCPDCGKNGEKCAIMGIQADQYRKFKNDSHSIKMFISTAPSAPFWAYNYQIQVKLARPSGFKDRTGDINLMLSGSKNNYDIKLSTKSGELIHGATYSFFITKQEELGNVKRILFKWISKSWNIFPLNFFSRKHDIYLDFVKITPLNIIDRRTREKLSKKFCYHSSKPIETEQSILLTECI